MMNKDCRYCYNVTCLPEDDESEEVADAAEDDEHGRDIEQQSLTNMRLWVLKTKSQRQIIQNKIAQDNADIFSHLFVVFFYTFEQIVFSRLEKKTFCSNRY